MGRPLYRDSEQLELRFPAWPWQGRPVRELTRGANLYTFTARGAPADTSCEIVEQLELFPEGTPYGTSKNGTPIQ